jgi:ribosomal protein L21E
MTTLELFKKHRKGEVSRERFLYEVRRDNNLPWVTNITSYDDAVKILKNKGIIREAQFEPQNITTDPAVDRANPYAVKREVQKLLAKEKELTNDSYKIALNKAAKKIAGNPQAIKDAMFVNADTVAKADEKLQMTPVKNNNFVDKERGMKKIKGQEALKAMSAPTKENRKGKPKGVKVMPDKGVEGSQKIIKEISEYIKKKLAENSMFHEFHQSMEVETAKGPGKVKEINGGTVVVELEDGTLVHEQMNTLRHRIENPKEEAEMPKQEESTVKENEYSQDFDSNEKLEIGDRIKVTYGNEFYGMTGTVEDFSPSGEFVIVSVDDHEGEYSMHASDVEKIEDEEDFDEEIYEADDNNSDFQNGDKIKITSELSRYRGATGEIHDLHDDGTAMVILDDPKRTAITVDLGHVKKLTEEELEEFTTAKTKDAAHNADIMKSIDTNVTNPIAKTQLKKNFNAGQAIDL